MQIISHNIKVKDIKVHYLEGGKGKTLMFFHGAFVRAQSYLPALEKLAKKYHVIAPDIPCFGDSGTPKCVMNFDDFGEFFIAFTKQLNLKVSYIVGHSFGGGVTFSLAARCPDVEKVVLIDAAGIKVQRGLKLIWNFITKQPLYIMRNIKDRRKIREAFGEIFRTVRKKAFKSVQIGKIVYKSVSQDYPSIKNIEAPTLIVWGKDDELFSKEDANTFNQRLKNSQLQFIDSNHDWAFFYPDKLTEILDKFFSEK